MTDDLLGRVRSVCLGFPQATEETTWGHQTFRVRGKIFAIFSEVDVEDGDRSVASDRRDSPAVATVSMKAPPGEQELLLAEQDPFFRPAHAGSRGWICLGPTADFEEFAELVEDDYRLVAPKRPSGLLDA